MSLSSEETTAQGRLYSCGDQLQIYIKMILCAPESLNVKLSALRDQNHMQQAMTFKNNSQAT